MDIKEIELMRKLQKKYYMELENKRRYQPKGMYVNVHMLFLYRLSLVFTIGFCTAVLIDVF